MIPKHTQSPIIRLPTSLLAGLVGFTTIGCTNSTTSNPLPAPQTQSTAPIAPPSKPEKSAPIAIRDVPVVSSEPVMPPAASDAVPVKPEPEEVAAPIVPTPITPDAGTVRQAAQPETIEYPEITEGMAYSTFQRAAAEKGWQANISPNCTANVEPGSALCEEVPELQSCNLDFCQMAFKRGRASKFITLKVFGGNRDQNALGRDSKWRVISWSIDNDNSQP